MKAPPKGATEGICRDATCGRKILWVKVDGTDIPLDPVRVSTYLPGIDLDGRPAWVKREGLAYLSHFKTCPAASKFARGSRRSQERAP